MTLLRKYYSPGIEGGGIPDEVIKMLEEKFRLPTEKELGDFESIEDAVSHMATQNLCFAMSKYGYSLAFEELARLKEENERLRGEGWISVEDRLPIVDKTVLCLFKHGRMDVCKYTKVFEMEFVENAICVTTKITHWQPLPEPPSPTKK